MPRGTNSTVLLIEPDMFLRRLIVLGLERRGTHVIAVSSLATLADQPIESPDLLVLDIDNGCHDDIAPLAAVEAHPYLSKLPMVVLAWDQVLPAARGAALPLRECLLKPFDARALHAAIDRLLLEVEESRAAHRQERYLATSRASVAPSIWPLVTAIGLLLAMIGLMLQLTVTAIGLLVVITALLCWTLGPNRKPEPLPV